MISCRSSLFLVADVLFGRVGTGGVESDEREIQERASEITGSLPLILIPSYILGWRDQACARACRINVWTAISRVDDCYDL